MYGKPLAYIVKIDSISPIEGADKIELAHVMDYTAEAILKHYNIDKNGESSSPFMWTTLTKTNLGGDYVMLEELLKKIENPDPALLHPADYTLPKE